MSPDAVAKIYFYKKEQGGLTNSFSPNRLSCPFKIGDSFYEGVVLNDFAEIGPDQTHTFPIIFLEPELVLPKIIVGTKFFLMRNAVQKHGEGEIIRLLNKKAQYFIN